MECGLDLADVVGGLGLERHLVGEGDQADLGRGEVALVEERPSGELRLEERRSGHARRDVDEEVDPRRIGGALCHTGGGRQAEPGEVVGDRLDLHLEGVAGVALVGPDLDDAVDVVRHLDVDPDLGIGRLDAGEDVFAEDRAVERPGALPWVR